MVAITTVILIFPFLCLHNNFIIWDILLISMYVQIKHAVIVKGQLPAHRVKCEGILGKVAELMTFSNPSLFSSHTFHVACSWILYLFVYRVFFLFFYLLSKKMQITAECSFCLFLLLIRGFVSLWCCHVWTVTHCQSHFVMGTRENKAKHNE